MNDGTIFPQMIGVSAFVVSVVHPWFSLYTYLQYVEHGIVNSVCGVLFCLPHTVFWEMCKASPAEGGASSHQPTAKVHPYPVGWTRERIPLSPKHKRGEKNENMYMNPMNNWRVLHEVALFGRNVVSTTGFQLETLLGTNLLEVSIGRGFGL